MRQGRAVTYIYGDHLGSTSVTFTDGVVNKQTYFAYGAVRTTDGLPTDYTFTGQKYDSYINLIQMGARWYDYSLGRFVQPDSIIPNPYNPQSLNRYAYVLNNPVKYRDPTGHKECGDSTTCDDPGEERNELIDEISQYSILMEGYFRLDELRDLNQGLNGYSSLATPLRVRELITAGVHRSNPTNSQLILRRTEDGTTGWYDREGRIDLPNAAFDPNGNLAGWAGLFDRPDVGKWSSAHELGHIIADGLRQEGIALDSQYGNRVTVDQQGRFPLHGSSDVNDEIATALALDALAQTGMWVGPDYTNNLLVQDFIRSVANPALRFGVVPRSRSVPR